MIKSLNIVGTSIYLSYEDANGNEIVIDRKVENETDIEELIRETESVLDPEEVKSIEKYLRIGLEKEERKKRLRQKLKEVKNKIHEIKWKILDEAGIKEITPVGFDAMKVQNGKLIIYDAEVTAKNERAEYYSIKIPLNENANRLWNQLTELEKEKERIEKELYYL